MDGKSKARGVRLSSARALCAQGILLCRKLSNKQSDCVVFRPVRVVTL